MINIENLKKSFGATEILKGINLDIAEGEFVTLLGASGCGKSTLLRIIAGLERADSGALVYDDTVLDNASENKFVPAQARKFGFVFQDHALWPHLSIDDNIGFPLRSYGWSKADIARRVSEVLSKVQMSEHAGKFPRQLSGGQRQRVGIARALALSPKVILLDEPLASLDSNLRDELGHEIRKLSKELGLTCINVTHDRREAQILSDRIAVMSSGQIRKVGAPLEVFKNPATVEIAKFLNAGNILPHHILPHHILTPNAPDAAPVLLPRNAVHIVKTEGDFSAPVHDMIFIDGRFEVTVNLKGHSVTFYSETKPDHEGHVELAIAREQIVHLDA